MDNAENTNNVENKRATRCCFTGHRPQKLTRPIDDIKVDLENEILAAIKKVTPRSSQVWLTVQTFGLETSSSG